MIPCLLHNDTMHESEINCPTWQVLGSEVSAKEREYFLSLRDSVVGCDVMVDKLVIKDVQLTAANDDNYFVFEDTILQVRSDVQMTAYCE